MNRKTSKLIIPLRWGIMLFIAHIANGGIVLEPSILSTDVSSTQTTVNNVVYDVLSVAGYPQYSVNTSPGDPSIPVKLHHFLLPTDQQIDEIEITSMDWDTLPGKYFLYPIQNADMEDSTFVEPNPIIYSSNDSWPSSPVQVISQSGMMGVGVASILATPIRYVPADSLLLTLSEIELSISMSSCEFEVIVPQSETHWSEENRIHAILSSVENPLDYKEDTTDNFRRDDQNQVGPLFITDLPSPNGDGVDLIIITNGSEMVTAWEDLAFKRTKQGIITVIRSVEWIEDEYSGCDTQEKIKNFITDAYEIWGTGMILLGGDHEIVPSRICRDIYSSGGFPSDGYYSDIDTEEESWINSLGFWEQPNVYIKMDLCVGRIPANNPQMVNTFIEKLETYENPISLPEGFGRSALFIGDICSTSTMYDFNSAETCDIIAEDLIDEGISSETGNLGKYLDPITELYSPASCSAWDGDELNRNSAISAINNGANIILHGSHSGSHLLGAKSDADASVREYITEGDIQSLTNEGMPSILLSTGCWPGNFAGCECIIERGLFSSNNTGLIAGMGLSRSGFWVDDEQMFPPFINALYEYSEMGAPPTIRLGPYVYLGHIYKHMLNISTTDSYTEYYMNLLGDPSMFVWRGNPSALTVTTNTPTVTAGTFNTTISVADDSSPIFGAAVCLYKEGELYAVRRTLANGDAVFNGVHVSTAGEITVTVTKRKSADIVHFFPAEIEIDVDPSTQPLLTLSDLTIDDDNLGGTEGNDDTEVNPGETIKLDLVVNNTGQNASGNASATLTIVSGGDQIAAETDMTESLGEVPVGETTYSGAFELQIAEDIRPGNDPVLLRVSFEYGLTTHTYPSDFRILVGELELPIRTMTITEDNSVVINIDNMLIANSGLGNLENVEVTFQNPSGGAVFTGNLTAEFGEVVNSTGESIEDCITATLANPSGCWNPIEPDATFELEISHRWGNGVIEVSAYDVIEQGVVHELNETTIEPINVDQESISYQWEPYTELETGWYLWKKEENFNWERENTLPLDPILLHGTITDLSPGTEYEIGVSALGLYGQESSIASSTVSTTCISVPGWPVYLDGSTGSGPAISDIDNDGNEEVIAATSAGSVYIIERDGATISKIYESSYHLSGIAIGDVIVGGRDEIVVSGWDYNVASGGKKGVVIILRWAQMTGWQGTEVYANSDGDQRIHEFLTVPVLLNADNSGNLEIALRTFTGNYSSAGNERSWLYVWENESNQWSLMTGFPKILEGASFDFAAPVYIGSTDTDQYPELVVSNGIETLYWIEPETGDDATWNVSSAFPKKYASTFLDFNLGQSYMIAVNDGGTCKLITVGRHHMALTEAYYATACIDASNGGSSLWFSEAYYTKDFYGNLGGPAIADVDGDNDLDIANQFLGYAGNSSFAEYLTLSDGVRTDFWGLPCNPQQEDIGMSPVVIAGSEGLGHAIYGATSTVSNGSAFHSGDVVKLIPGSSQWSNDRMISTPAVGNLDSDSYLEIIFSDESGVLYALDIDLNSSSGDWPTLQHDLHRTGYYNFTGRGLLETDLDFQISNIYVENNSQLGERTIPICVDIVISGTDDTAYERSDTPIRLTSPNQALINNEELINSSMVNSIEQMEISNDVESVPVAIFDGEMLVEIKSIPLVNGSHNIRFNVESGREVREIFAIVDPFMEYPEINSDNNIMQLPSDLVSPSLSEEIMITLSSDGISIAIPAQLCSRERMNALLFSIDGRLVDKQAVENNSGGSAFLTLSNDSGSLPFGCYVILLEEEGEYLLRRKVLVIE